MIQKNRARLMWLFGIVAGVAMMNAAWAQPLPATWQQPETLTYKVNLSLLPIGQATLRYVPEGDAYTLSAQVRDSVPFYDIDDVWTMTGRHAGQAFTSARADIKQEEGSYKARKSLVFDRSAKVVRYEKASSPESTVTVPLTDELRDVLSALYLLRADGLAQARTARQLTVIASKEAFPLKVSAAVKDRTSVRGRTTDTYRVRMSVFYPAKKKDPARTETWDVWVLPDAKLTPVRIEAQLKMGRFIATLR